MTNCGPLQRWTEAKQIFCGVWGGRQPELEITFFWEVGETTTLALPCRKVNDNENIRLKYEEKVPIGWPKVGSILKISWRKERATKVCQVAYNMCNMEDKCAMETECRVDILCNVLFLI